jgi:hypothetical protein
MLRTQSHGVRTRGSHWSLLVLILTVAHGHVGECGEIRELQAGRFELHTDLPATELSGWLQRMERVVDLSEAYWCRKLPGRIRCYLVDDLSNWSVCDLPAEFAPRVLRHVSGGTDVVRAAAGSRMASQAVIYATTAPGVVEHEVVHAYCFQTFGRGGPDWYREGMAELFAQQVDLEHPMGRAERLERLRKAAPIQLTAILRNDSHRKLRDTMLSGGSTSRPTANTPSDTDDSPAFLLAESKIAEDTTRLDVPSTEFTWTESDEQRLETSKDIYAQSWALCHLLYHRPEYRERFRVLGRHLLSGAPVRFEQAFAPRMREIEFELRQFAEQVHPDYRPELCRWEWVAAPRSLAIGNTVGIRVQARRGFQAAKIVVEAGQVYEVTCEGQWHTGQGQAGIGAEGHANGNGCLVGTVMNNTCLSSPFSVGQQGSIEISESGQVYLRCQEAFHELSDNSGSILVRITRIR